METFNFQNWRDRVIGINDHIHFNHAGCSFPDQAVFKAIIDHLEKEQRKDGYALQFDPESQLDQVYKNIATLIHASASEIAVTQSASDAIVKALLSIPFSSGDRILTTPWEYGTNFLNYMWLRDHKGVQIDVIPVDANGYMDLEAGSKMVNDRTRLISITHVPTSSGAIAPIEYFGKLAKEHGILYLVDACQSVGQIPVDVKEFQCDFLCATSRKYMRGPRGMGFLYVKESVMDQLEFSSINMMSGTWTAPEDYALTRDIKLFDHWEKSFSILKGFDMSVQIMLQIGVEKIWSRIQELAAYFRTRIRELGQYTLMDKGDQLCGIVTFRHKKISTEQVFHTLAKAGINSSISYNWSSFTDLHNKGTESVNRCSIHFVNTKQEIDQCMEVLREL